MVVSLFLGIGIGAAATPGEEQSLEAQALPPMAIPHGPEGDYRKEGYFNEEISIQDGAGTPVLARDVITFLSADGWDFGDRIGYKCSWAEFYHGTNEKFEVHFEVVADYPQSVKIKDRWGSELNFQDLQIMYLCGSGGEGNNPNPTLDFDGTDHFPHMIHPGDGIEVFENGDPIAFVDLAAPECRRLYWVPGDEAGEAWLWWDADGPTFSHAEGEGELSCGGAPGEPDAIVHVTVANADPGIGYCTVAMDERLCS